MNTIGCDRYRGPPNRKKILTQQGGRERETGEGWVSLLEGPR